jgi:DNA-binding CsgD family transcriptional regulator
VHFGRSKDRNQLTSRELEIVRLAAQGATDDQIAAQLAISPSTVHSHLMHAYQKARVHRRRDLIMWFRRQHEPLYAFDRFPEGDASPG